MICPECHNKEINGMEEDVCETCEQRAYEKDSDKKLWVMLIGLLLLYTLAMTAIIYIKAKLL